MANWWSEILLAVVGSILFALGAKWVGTPRVPARPGRGTGTLRYPRSALGMGVGFMVLFGGLALYTVLSPDEDQPFWVPFGFLWLVPVGAVLVAQYFRVSYTLIPGGMRYQPLWRGPGALSWSDVTRVTWWPPANWFRIDTAGGRPVRLSVMLTGLPEFARALLAEAPADAMDAETRQTVAQVADGYLPDDA